jgi:hypothetical protein
MEWSKNINIMKKLVLFIAAVTLSYAMATAQGCLPEGITFTTQAQIDSFPANYPGCTEIKGDVLIGEWNGSDITNLNGLSVLNSIEGSLEIAFNIYLTGLSGLDNLSSIGGNLKIGFNNSLSSLEGLEGLTTIGGNLEIGFQSGMMLLGNASLTSIEGLTNLTSVGGKLYIAENPVLTSLIGLANLTVIGDSLRISYNEGLTSLTGLDNIEANSLQNILIHFNSNLTECDIQPICDYLSSQTGLINIHNNAPGCNSPEEVEEACLTTVKDNYSEIEITISPNPVSYQAVLSFNVSNYEPVKVCIYNLTGICEKSWEFENQQPGRKDYSLELTDLPAGIYFCRLQVGKQGVTRKIIFLK